MRHGSRSAYLGLGHRLPDACPASEGLGARNVRTLFLCDLRRSVLVLAFGPIQGRAMGVRGLHVALVCACGCVRNHGLSHLAQAILARIRNRPAQAPLKRTGGRFSSPFASGLLELPHELVVVAPAWRRMAKMVPGLVEAQRQRTWRARRRAPPSQQASPHGREVWRRPRLRLGARWQRSLRKWTA